MSNALTSFGLHVEQVRFVTDAALPQAQAQALGARFAAEFDTVLRARRPHAASLRIHELVVEAGLRELQDPQGLRRLAQAAAQRVLARTPE